MARKNVVDFLEEPICYSAFYEEYLVGNKPCLLSDYFTSSWPCRRDWVKDGLPNWKHLCDQYGSCTAPVADCLSTHYNSHSKSDWKLTDYVNYIIDYKTSSYPSSKPCLYLKDWHFPKMFPDSKVYETAIYFSVDWLNEHWLQDNDTDDYRFVYIGPKGSWTPFHADVYGSFSWSANVIGRKRWILLPPGQEVLLKTQLGLTSLPTDLTSIGLESTSIQFADFIQEAGQTLFVPSGWHHQVWNLEDTISINHNWFNGSNVSHIHAALKKASVEVEAELRGYGVDDDSNFEVLLSCHHGMNFTQFKSLLNSIYDRRQNGFLKIHSSAVCPTLKHHNRLCNDDQHRLNDLNNVTSILVKL